MKESQFWECIDQASASDDFADSLRNVLHDLDLEEIISFKNIFLKKLVEAYVFPLLAANFVISSYVSDDGFEEFRAWLVSKGKLSFQNAVDSPETIADWLEKEEVDEVEGHKLLNIADEVYAELGGEEEEFYKSVIFPPEPDINMTWPENKSEFQLEYPKLVAKFWNQQKIQELHSD